jgi:hypothetical protein
MCERKEKKKKKKEKLQTRLFLFPLDVVQQQSEEKKVKEGNFSFLCV